jgi:hypothetical protein
MGIIAAARQARLRPECADGYPTLPVHRWTPASCLSALVDSYRGTQAQSDGTAEKGRMLPDHDFQFRGGLPRQFGRWFARTRIGELRYCGSV